MAKKKKSKDVGSAIAAIPFANVDTYWDINDPLEARDFISYLVNIAEIPVQLECGTDPLRLSKKKTVSLAKILADALNLHESTH